MEDVKLERSIKTINAVGKPILLIFSDSSERAFGTCAYIGWNLQSGEQISRLLVSRRRVAHLKKITIVKLERNAAILAKRFKNCY